MKPESYLAACAVAAGVLLLAGCSGGPSEAEIQKAFGESLAASLSMFAAFSGEASAAPAANVKSVDSHGCERANGKPGYNCTFTVEIELPNGQSMKRQETTRFVQGERGWFAASD